MDYLQHRSNRYQGYQYRAIQSRKGQRVPCKHSNVLSIPVNDTDNQGHLFVPGLFASLCLAIVIAACV